MLNVRRARHSGPLTAHCGHTARAHRMQPLPDLFASLFDCPENRVDACTAYCAWRFHAAVPAPFARPCGLPMSGLNDRLEARLAREWQQRGALAWALTPFAGGFGAIAAAGPAAFSFVWLKSVRIGGPVGGGGNWHVGGSV